MTYAEHDLQAFRDRIYVTTGARLTLTDAAVELDRIRGVYGTVQSQAFAVSKNAWTTTYSGPQASLPTSMRMADDYFQPVDP